MTKKYRTIKNPPTKGSVSLKQVENFLLDLEKGKQQKELKKQMNKKYYPPAWNYIGPNGELIY